MAALAIAACALAALGAPTSASASFQVVWNGPSAGETLRPLTLTLTMLAEFCDGSLSLMSTVWPHKRASLTEATLSTQ
jgi:hypothetical protein